MKFNTVLNEISIDNLIKYAQNKDPKLYISGHVTSIKDIQKKELSYDTVISTLDQKKIPIDSKLDKLIKSATNNISVNKEVETRELEKEQDLSAAKTNRTKNIYRPAHLQSKKI